MMSDVVVALLAAVCVFIYLLFPLLSGLSDSQFEFVKHCHSLVTLSSNCLLFASFFLHLSSRVAHMLHTYHKIINNNHTTPMDLFLHSTHCNSIGYCNNDCSGLWCQ